MVGDARGAGRETRAVTLQFRAVLRHALSWVVGDRNGHNKKKWIVAAARGRRCVVAWLSLPIWHLAPRIPVLPKTGQYRRYYRVVPGLDFNYPVFGQLYPPRPQAESRPE